METTGNADKAERLLCKSMRLYPNSTAESLLNTLKVGLKAYESFSMWLLIVVCCTSLESEIPVH